MSHKNKVPLVDQVKQTLDSKLSIGRSKHQDKISEKHSKEITSNYIYSWSTYRSYLKHGCYFVLWCKIHDAADIHSYRADYATAIYLTNARPLDQIPKCDRYYCRKDKKGIWYDKEAMKITSKALGHSRISVIAEHYLNNSLFLK